MPSRVPDPEIFKSYNPNSPLLRNNGIWVSKNRTVLDFKAIREELLRQVSEEDKQGAASKGHGDK